MFQKILLASALMLALMAATGTNAWAQSRAEELQTYLQKLEADKLQYKNDPARYQEYENKIASIKQELGISSVYTPKPTPAYSTEQEHKAHTLTPQAYNNWKQEQVGKTGSATQATKVNETVFEPAVTRNYQTPSGAYVENYEFPTYFSGSTKFYTHQIAGKDAIMPPAAVVIFANLLMQEKGIVNVTYNQEAKTLQVECYQELYNSDVLTLIQKVGSSQAFENQIKANPILVEQMNQIQLANPKTKQ